MRDRPKLVLIVLIFTLFFILIGCNLIPQGMRDIFATKTPTSTPTPTATPLPPIDISGCAVYSLCPDADRLLSYYDGDIQAGKETYIQFQFDRPMRLSLGWIAIDQQTLEDNLKHIHFYYKIDEVRYDNPSMFAYGVSYDDQGNPTNYPAYYMGVVMSGWKVGIIHTLTYGYVIDSKINDGWNDYEPGTVEFSIIAMPLDMPTATPTATETPTVTPTETPTETPTRTPRPIIYTPRPTVVPPTATQSCNANQQIQIDNSTGDIVKLYLTGPAKYFFNLDTGNTTLNVCAGQYSYSAYGCGGASDTGEIDSGSAHKFYCSSN